MAIRAPGYKYLPFGKYERGGTYPEVSTAMAESVIELC
jgi:hypothetical protein